MKWIGDNINCMPNFASNKYKYKDKGIIGAVILLIRYITEEIES